MKIEQNFYNVVSIKKMRQLNREQDREFTRMFGTLKPKPVSAPTYVLFTIRDAMTVGASFNLPDPVSLYLQERLGMSKKTADVTAQVCAYSSSSIDVFGAVVVKKLVGLII